MPGFIKTGRDEELWQKAKGIVEKEYSKTEADGDEYWKLVTAVYKKAGGSIGKSLLYSASELDIMNLEKSASKKPLPEGGVWRTIKGHKVYIKDGEILAGHIPGVTDTKEFKKLIPKGGKAAEKKLTAKAPEKKPTTKGKAKKSGSEEMTEARKKVDEIANSRPKEPPKKSVKEAMAESKKATDEALKKPNPKSKPGKSATKEDLDKLAEEGRKNKKPVPKAATPEEVKAMFDTSEAKNVIDGLEIKKNTDDKYRQKLYIEYVPNPNDIGSIKIYGDTKEEIKAKYAQIKKDRENNQHKNATGLKQYMGTFAKTKNTKDLINLIDEKKLDTLSHSPVSFKINRVRAIPLDDAEAVKKEHGIDIDKLPKGKTIEAVGLTSKGEIYLTHGATDYDLLHELEHVLGYREDLKEKKGGHYIVKEALNSGKSVPASILKEYPELQSKKVADIRSEKQAGNQIAYDVGEKVGGARKDLAVSGFKERATGQSLDELEKIAPELAQKMCIKANILQPVDFEKEYKTGTAIEVAIAKKLIYDRIAPKPPSDTPEARAQYLNAIRSLQRSLEPIKSWDEFKEARKNLGHWMRNETQKSRDDYASAVKFAEQKLKEGPRDYELTDWHYDRATGKRVDTAITKEQWMERQRQRIQEMKNHVKESEEFAKSPYAPLGEKLTNFFTDSESANRTIDTINKKNPKWEDYFSKENTSEEKKPKESRNKIVWERIMPAKIQRSGGRKTAVAKPEDMLKAFNLRGVEFGNWVDDTSGKFHLIKCAEAFQDLADIIEIDDKDVSLNGRLAIAFGARGHGAAGEVVAVAHYEPSNKVINITKEGGAGSLAHEWGHALDNIMYQQSTGQSSMNLASNGMGSKGDPAVKAAYDKVMNAILVGSGQGMEEVPNKHKTFYSYHPSFKQAVQELGLQRAIKKGAEIIDKRNGFDADLYRHYGISEADIEKRREKFDRKRKMAMNEMVQEMAYHHEQLTGEKLDSIPIPNGKSKYYEDSAHAGGSVSYYTSSHEMFARAFENYIQGKMRSGKVKNDYLVYGTWVDGNNDSGILGVRAPYPCGKERDDIHAAFDELITAIRKSGAIKKGLSFDLEKSMGHKNPGAYAQQAILKLHKKLGYEYPENSPGISAEASGDYGEIWVQIWSTGMDWNCYWYMLDSDHDEPRLIATMDNSARHSDGSLVSLSDEVPKDTKYTNNLWQNMCDNWVHRHNKKLDKSFLQKSLSHGEELNRCAYALDWTSFDEDIESVFYIPINRLKTDYQTSEALDFDKIKDIVAKMLAGQSFPPIVIGYDYDVHDGHHRIEASKILKFTHVPCVVRGNNAIRVQQAKEGYRELWKSFDESEHPRDAAGRFTDNDGQDSGGKITEVYHLTRDKDFKYDPNYKNTKQEMGAGLYTTPMDDAMYWHRALQDKDGSRHRYAIPIDVSEAKLIHADEIPYGLHELAKHLISHYGSADEALKHVDEEESEISGEIFGNEPSFIAQRRLYAKTKGYDGIVLHDDREGTQVLLFNGDHAKFKPAITADDLFDMKKHKDFPFLYVNTLQKSISRADAKNIHKDLPSGGVWRTIRGHHIYILNGTVIAGAIPGVTGPKKASKAQLKEHQANIDKEAKNRYTVGKEADTSKNKPDKKGAGTDGKSGKAGPSEGRKSGQKAGKDKGTDNRADDKGRVQQGGSGGSGQGILVEYKKAKPEEFHKAIAAAKANNDHGAFVDLHDVEDYGKDKLLLSPSGGAGCAVEPNGNIVSAFKDPKSNESGAMHSILINALKNGGNKLDCYDGFLPKAYAQHGFVPVARLKFNREYASPDWNYERDGEPDVVFMAHNGDSVDDVKAKMGSYPMPDMSKVPYVEDYDAGIKARDDYMKGIKNTSEANTNSKKAAKGAAEVKKEPWQMTREEYALKDLSVKYVDDAIDAAGADAAGKYKRGSNEVVVKRRKNQFITDFVRKHEEGHYLYDHLQNVTVSSIMTENPDLWAEVKSMSAVKPYLRHGSLPASVDWVEVLPDMRAEAWAKPDEVGDRVKKFLANQVRGAEEHGDAVRKAVKAGKRVPDAVLNEYGITVDSKKSNIL